MQITTPVLQLQGCSPVLGRTAEGGRVIQKLGLQDNTTTGTGLTPLAPTDNGCRRSTTAHREARANAGVAERFE